MVLVDLNINYRFPRRHFLLERCNEGFVRDDRKAEFGQLLPRRFSGVDELLCLTIARRAQTFPTLFFVTVLDEAFDFRVFFRHKLETNINTDDALRRGGEHIPQIRHKLAVFFEPERDLSVGGSEFDEVVVHDGRFSFVGCAATGSSRVSMLRPLIAQRRTAGGSLCAPPFALATPAMNADSTRRDLTVLGLTDSRTSRVRRSVTRLVISGVGILVSFLLSRKGLFSDAKVVVVRMKAAMGQESMR